MTVALDAATAPWADLLFYTTEVDGKRWSALAHEVDRTPIGASWKGRGRDVIYAACAAPGGGGRSGLAEGKHRVVIKAKLLGTAVA